jgi:hypothetical protein
MLPPPLGQFGNMGRNTFPDTGFRNVDFSVAKNWHFGERLRAQFRAEFFNIFNHPNFAVPTNTTGPNGAGGNGDAIFLGPTAPAANAGQIFSTVSSSRQIQFGLRLSF